MTFCILVRKSFFVLWRRGLLLVIHCCLNFGKGFCNPGLHWQGWSSWVCMVMSSHPNFPFWAEKQDCNLSSEISSGENFRFSSLIPLLSSSPYWLHNGASHLEPSGCAAASLDRAVSALNNCRGSVFVCSHAIWQWEISGFFQKINEFLYASRWNGKFCWP